MASSSMVSGQTGPIWRLEQNFESIAVSPSVALQRFTDPIRYGQQHRGVSMVETVLPAFLVLTLS